MTTKKSAKQVVIEVFEKEIGEVDDGLARTVLDRELVEEVFDIAWKYQFNEKRKQFRNEVEDLVSDRIERQKLIARENDED